MEAVVFCGIQASGKTSWYRERFADTHVRINLDELKTRRREADLLRSCIAERRPFVVDNTNPTAAERRRYVEPAAAAGYRVVAHLFDASPREAIARNRERPERERIPVPGILGTYKRLEPPRPEEGFDALFRVRLDREGRFHVAELPPAVSRPPP